MVFVCSHAVYWTKSRSIRSSFLYSIELLVKCHGLGWPIAEVAAQWHEQFMAPSRFRIFKWLPAYGRWYLFALATTYLRRPARTVRLRHA